MSRRGGVYDGMGGLLGTINLGRRGAAIGDRHAGMGDQALEGGARMLDGAGVAQESGVVVQRKDQAVDLEQQLLDVGVGTQMAFDDGGADRPAERAMPGLDHRHQGVADRSGAVVELDRAADVDAARVDLDRDATHPAVEQRAQPRQAALGLHGRHEDLVLELGVILGDDRDLQLLARAEVGENTRLAHPRHLGEGADRQSLEADLRCQAERCVENRGPGLLAFEERTRRRGLGAGNRGRIGGLDD